MQAESAGKTISSASMAAGESSRWQQSCRSEQQTTTVKTDIFWWHPLYGVLAAQLASRTS
jgi:hypothetical protein